MHPSNNTARVAGALYLLNGATGFFSIMYVPSTLIVSANPAATANSILAFEMLFRVGIVFELTCAVTFIFLVRALYRLLNGGIRPAKHTVDGGREASLEIVRPVSASGSKLWV